MIGIVASRLVERFHRPVVLIAGADGEWKGSGRSIPAFDLHGGLAACAEHLERFGGHRAAAGLSIRPENVDAFADAFAAHADAHLTDDDLRPVTRSTRSFRAGADARPLRRASAGSPRSVSATPASTCSCPLRAHRPRARGGGQAPALPRRATAATAAARSRSAWGRQLDRYRRVGPLRRGVPARGEPLERDGLAAARRPPHLRDARPLRRAARAGSPAQWRLDGGGARRLRRTLHRARARRGEQGVGHLSSERFRALLAEPASPRGLARHVHAERPSAARCASCSAPSRMRASSATARFLLNRLFNTDVISSLSER